VGETKNAQGYKNLFLNPKGKKLLGAIHLSAMTNWRPRAGSGPHIDLLRPPPSHKFGSIGESINICFNIIGAT
jgi:hypothetical protein